MALVGQGGNQSCCSVTRSWQMGVGVAVDRGQGLTATMALLEQQLGICSFNILFPLSQQYVVTLSS